jgi:cytoskeleton protein RodZ
MSYPQDEFEAPQWGDQQPQPDVVSDDDAGLSVGPETDPVVGAGVMPLDTGSSPEAYQAELDWKTEVTPSITDAPTLGDGLRLAREASGLSLAELAAQTRVHHRYLTALEQNDHANLPSRVFAIGHVRAYAAALGLDEHLAVDRFKREAPDETAILQPPTGAAFDEVKRQSPRLIAACLAVVVAVVGWNVFQRVSLMQAAAPSSIAQTPESWSLGTVPGVMRLGAPRPAPPDQTVPALYITPGLEAQLAGIDPDDAEAVAALGAAAAPVQAAFNPRGAIYGERPAATQVVIQARKAASLVVRMGDGRVLFARQLAAGEAWRAPAGVTATVDASEPGAFDVYLNGEHGGALPGVLTPLSQLNNRAQERARHATVEAATRAEAVRRAAAEAPVPVASVPASPVMAAPVTLPAAPVPAPTPVPAASAVTDGGASMPG